jgi:hypothetical protein
MKQRDDAMKNHRYQICGKPLPDEVLLELGRITASWAGLEKLLNDVLKKLASSDAYLESGVILPFRQASFLQRLHVFGSYCGQLALEHPYLNKYRKIQERLKTVRGLRNRFIHNELTFNRETGTIELAIGSESGPRTEVVHVEDLRRVSMEIDAAHESLYALVFWSGKKPIPVG